MSPPQKWDTIVEWSMLLGGIGIFMTSFNLKKGYLRPFSIYLLRAGGVIMSATGLAQLLGWLPPSN